MGSAPISKLCVGINVMKVSDCGSWGALPSRCTVLCCQKLSQRRLCCVVRMSQDEGCAVLSKFLAVNVKTHPTPRKVSRALSKRVAVYYVLGLTLMRLQLPSRLLKLFPPEMCCARHSNTFSTKTIYPFFKYEDEHCYNIFVRALISVNTLLYSL